ncbi:MAG: hypothetical protein KJN84_05485 [Bacteroidia bacterium]|nr:hypothetical protein [Bacteroidia bacterium]
MKTSKLITALMTLNKEEWFLFRKYLLYETSEESEIFGLFTFYQSRKGRLEKLDDTDEIRQKHFSDYAPKIFLNLNSKLYNLFEDWLAYYQFKSEPHQSQLSLLKALNKRGLYKHADQVAKSIGKRIEKNQLLSMDDIKASNAVNHLQYFSNNPIKYNSGTALLEGTIDNHLAFINIQSSLYLTELINFSKVQNQDYSQLISQLKSHLNDSTSPLEKKSLQLPKLFVDPNEKLFIKLKDFLFENKLQYPSEFHTLFTLYLLSISLKLWSKNLISSPNPILELYDYIFEKDVISENGKIPVIRFHNIIGSLSTFKNDEWLKGFISNWINKVDTSQKLATKCLAEAQVSFSMENYDQILNLLSGLEYDTIDQKVRARSLELIAFYKDEDKKHDLFFNSAHNFKRLLKRHKNHISEKLYKANNNLILLLEKIIKSDYKNLDINLSHYDYLIHRSWCIGQVKLKKSK